MHTTICGNGLCSKLNKVSTKEVYTLYAVERCSLHEWYVAIGNFGAVTFLLHLQAVASRKCYFFIIQAS